MQINDADRDRNEDFYEETDCLIGNKWSGDSNEGSVETMCCAGVTTLFSGTLT